MSLAVCIAVAVLVTLTSCHAPRHLCCPAAVALPLFLAARQIAARQGHSGALLPSHIRAAYNALSADGRVPHRNMTRRLM
jgi:hypothetical protein